MEAHEEVKSLFNSSTIRGTTRGYLDGVWGNVEGRRHDEHYGGMSGGQGQHRNQGSDETDERSSRNRSRHGDGSDIYDDSIDRGRVGSSGMKSRENKNKNENESYRNESTRSVVESFTKEETHGNRNSERTKDRDKQFKSNERDCTIGPISMERSIGARSSQNHRYDPKTDYEGSDSDSDDGYHGVTDRTHGNYAENNNAVRGDSKADSAKDKSKNTENRNSENSFASSSQNSSRTTEPRTYDAKKSIASTDSPAPYGSDTSERHQNNHQNLTEENAVDNYGKTSGKIKRNSYTDVENNRKREETVQKNNQNGDSERRYGDSRRPESVKYGNDEIKGMKSTGSRNENTVSSNSINKNNSVDISEGNEEEVMRRQIEQMYGTNVTSSTRRTVSAGGNGTGIGGEISPSGDGSSRSSGQNHGNGDITGNVDDMDGHSTGRSVDNDSNKSNKNDKNNGNINNNNDDNNSDIGAVNRINASHSINEDNTKDHVKSEKSVKAGNKIAETADFSSIKEKSNDGQSNQLEDKADRNESSAPPPPPPPLPLPNYTVVSTGMKNSIFYHLFPTTNLTSLTV
jgi:hypothetical protein